MTGGENFHCRFVGLPSENDGALYGRIVGMNNSIGSKIHELRKKKGITQEELGDIIGVSRQAISKWELNEMTPNIENINMLSSYFKVSLNYFLDGSAACPSDAPAAEQAAAKVSDYFKRWVVTTIIVGIVAVFMSVFTVCMCVILFTTNTGDQIVHTVKIELWGLIILIVISLVLIIIETVLLIITLKKRKCKR